jgi:DNA helicase-2/ATP-dependent DNA helicase PcrA
LALPENLKLAQRATLNAMDLLEGLNEPQRRAVTHKDGPLLIFAGAGSGKTRTLTHRIAWLINEEHVPPARILAVTFTNKASREMRERLENLIGPSAKRMWLGTFHALCAKMLRIHGERIDLNPRFAIFDSDDQLRLMKSVVKDSGLDTERFPPAARLGACRMPKTISKRPKWRSKRRPKPHEKVYAQLYKTYQERLRAASALDFDDLLMEAVRLLKQSPETLEHWRQRFLHVLIDEFQDVNEAQFQWAQMLASEHRNICVVGDDDQCLAAGTLVTTPNGDKKIEDVVAGDLVLSGVGDSQARFCEVLVAKSNSLVGLF